LTLILNVRGRPASETRLLAVPMASTKRSKAVKTLVRRTLSGGLWRTDGGADAGHREVMSLISNTE